jgi:creatinine amidohydrolase/Fe(II)-dependent formamide hydrolase-like protein
MKLEQMRAEHVRQAVKELWPLFLPIGTIEYHGEHLPLGVDGFAVIDALKEVENRVPCAIAPIVWYGPSSYAVAGPEGGTIDVDVDNFEKHVHDILQGMLATGFRRIVVVIHHQFEEGNLMPAALACRKAALKLTFQHLENERGKGWWGSPKMKHYYELMGTTDDPFSWIRIVPLMSPDIQQAMGYDHAGKLETSLMLATRSETVDLKPLQSDGLWYTKSAGDASKEHGERTLEMIVDYLVGLTQA